MRNFVKKGKQAGFTLIELMIVVAIIGILAVLAIFGVRRYLASAKSAEATNSLGAMQRGAVAAYERESAPSELLTGGQLSQNASHQLCNTATPVPGTVPSNQKYQPNTTAGTDFKVGNATTGWPCLKFELAEPIYYQYQYNRGSAPVTTGGGGQVPGGIATGWESGAMGNLNGDAINSYFAGTGTIANGTPVTSTQIFVANAEE